jgi:methyl-accepting chemotaxis protein
MRWFNDWKIGKKLGIGFGGILLLTATLGILSLVQLTRLNANVIDIGANWMASITYLGQLRLDASKERRWELNTFFAADKAEARRQMEAAVSEMEADEKLYEPTINTDEERQLYQGFHSEWDKHVAVRDRFLGLLQQGKEKEANALSGTEGLTGFAAADRFLGDDVKLNIKGGADAVKAAAATYSSSRYLVIALLAGSIMVGLFVAIGLGRSLASSAGGMLAMIQQVAANNLTVEDMNVISNDEIGQAGAALNQMKNSLHLVVESIAENSLHLASASEQLSNTSQKISANSEETSAQAKVVSDSAHQVSQNLQTVATGAEEMGVSIREIAKNATEAARVATSAVKVAETTTATVSKLGDSSNEIGQVIKVITSIAEQTNLLALNATIEAARAGEAGKGFAVVANEVKELAKETAKATEDISRKIEAIQEDTKAAVEAIASISEVINRVNGISTTIATAVEEQNATTNEMSRNVSEAAHSSGEITSNINGVAQAAESTSRGAGDTQKAAQQLVETSAELRRLVEQFRINGGGSGRGSGGMAVPAQGRAAYAGS